MILEEIQRLLDNRNITWTAHCLERMGERDISIADVKNCILHGEVIEEYTDDYPHPSCLIYGRALDGRVIHGVTGSDSYVVYIITAYEPNIITFEEDLKTRRK